MDKTKPLSELVSEYFKDYTRRSLLRKAVFAKPKDKGIKKTQVTPVFAKALTFKVETFLSDGKDLQKIFSEKEFYDIFLSGATFDYRQITFLGEKKQTEILISDKGNYHVTGGLDGDIRVALSENQDKTKNYILTSENGGKFLSALGITDESGKIHDKKQAKYRQINKFLEQIENILPSLPKTDKLTVWDLCCGKSYLTFAVYWYFTEILGRETTMYGVDLKADVIAFCEKTAKDLGYSGMRFYCEDVGKFSSESTPDLVISLHACDVATDHVLAGAVKSGAKVILSTPCCQHEFNSQMRCDTLSFITEHSMLKQKLAAAATDALRAKMLEIHGYKVTVLELIDPEETPKNLLIRAEKTKKIPDLDKKCKEYKDACALLGVTPTLYKLLGLPETEGLKSVTVRG